MAVLCVLCSSTWRDYGWVFVSATAKTSLIFPNVRSLSSMTTRGWIYSLSRWGIPSTNNGFPKLWDSPLFMNILMEFPPPFHIHTRFMHVPTTYPQHTHSGFNPVAPVRIPHYTYANIPRIPNPHLKQDRGVHMYFIYLHIYHTHIWLVVWNIYYFPIYWE